MRTPLAALKFVLCRMTSWEDSDLTTKSGSVRRRWCLLQIDMDRYR